MKVIIQCDLPSEQQKVIEMANASHYVMALHEIAMYIKNNKNIDNIYDEFINILEKNNLSRLNVGI